MSGTPRGEHKSSGSVEDRLKSVSLDSRKLPDTSNHSVVLGVWSFCVFFSCVLLLDVYVQAAALTSVHSRPN